MPEVWSQERFGSAVPHSSHRLIRHQGVAGRARQFSFTVQALSQLGTQPPQYRERMEGGSGCWSTVMRCTSPWRTVACNAALQVRPISGASEITEPPPGKAAMRSVSTSRRTSGPHGAGHVLQLQADKIQHHMLHNTKTSAPSAAHVALMLNWASKPVPKNMWRTWWQCSKKCAAC